MAITRVTIDAFLKLGAQYPIFDVRSPSEYSHAHIPGALSLPLFSDEERKWVGTAYKQESKQKAIKIGLKYFGTNMVQLVEQVETILKKLPANLSPDIILVHCWRGGMRSAGVAWLLDLYGFKVYTLAGGYKIYRTWVLEQFNKPYPIEIVGGYTGSGKTEVLKELKQRGQQVIDLEALANHKGSAFGNMGEPEQPTQEQFENLLAKELVLANNTIWMEDESQRIGKVNIPTTLFKQMRTKRVLFMDIAFEERLNHILKTYGKFEKEKLVNAIIRIKKRLGGLETKTAINFLLEDDIQGCFTILLKYYDRVYTAGSQKRDNPHELIYKIPCNKVNSLVNAIQLIEITAS
ncbi:MAG: tRNA 2-selenouridine(34) synthase MnmH [Sphingobacteriia bacterium]|nr:MAG: tRNA 2-selenouridine(34) synthase MnmH [Sphingobacteriia bacterium]